MSEGKTIEPVSKSANIIGWILTIVPSLLLLLSGVFKFIQPGGEEMLKSLEHIGWTPAGTFKLGFVEIGCTLIYLLPRTAVLGAVLLTAYMGGAVATHARVGDLFVAQIIFGMAIWGGLYFRDVRIRSLLPFN